jgi:hypothetical protein
VSQDWVGSDKETIAVALLSYRFTACKVLYEHIMSRLAFSDWTAEQFRCTAFILPGTALPAAHWWAKLADADPEEVTSSPRVGATQAVGRFGPGTLVVTTQPGRIDWFLVPGRAEVALVQEQAPPELAAPSLGGAVETFNAFSEVSRKWLAFEDIPDVNRLALGAVFSHPEENRRAAYVRLPEYVPVKVDPESTDFLYQINLPTQSRSGITGLVINRLSKWAVSMFKLIAMNLQGETFSQGFGATTALRSEIDVSTPQEFQGVLPKDRLIEIFNELDEHGRYLVTNGVA